MREAHGPLFRLFERLIPISHHSPSWVYRDIVESLSYLCTRSTGFTRGFGYVREKFGVAVSDELVDELDESVEECADPGAPGSEIVEGVITAYFKSEFDHAARVRELIIRRRKENRRQYLLDVHRVHAALVA